jgi:hypothetical protein
MPFLCPNWMISLTNDQKRGLVCAAVHLVELKTPMMRDLVKIVEAPYLPNLRPAVHKPRRLLALILPFLPLE